MPVKTLGALLLALAACAWTLAVLGQCPARLGFVFSLICGGLAWALVPWWSREASPAVGTPDAKAPPPVAAPEPPRTSSPPREKTPRGNAKGTLLERAPHAMTAREHALCFSKEVLAPARTDTPVAKLHSAYHDWCTARGEGPFPTREIGTELSALFERTGVEIVEIDGTRFIAGVRLKPRKAVLGRMATPRAAGA